MGIGDTLGEQVGEASRDLLVELLEATCFLFFKGRLQVHRLLLLYRGVGVVLLRW